MSIVVQITLPSEEAYKLHRLVSIGDDMLLIVYKDTVGEDFHLEGFRIVDKAGLASFMEAVRFGVYPHEAGSGEHTWYYDNPEELREKYSVRTISGITAKEIQAQLNINNTFGFFVSEPHLPHVEPYQNSKYHTFCYKCEKDVWAYAENSMVSEPEKEGWRHVLRVGSHWSDPKAGHLCIGSNAEYGSIPADD